MGRDTAWWRDEDSPCRGDSRIALFSRWRAEQHPAPPFFGGEAPNLSIES